MSDATPVATPAVPSATAEAPALSRAEKLEAKIAANHDKIVALQLVIEQDTATLESLQALENVETGDVVHFNFGRGENRKEHVGTVLGVADTDKGRRIKVYTGEGFDAQVLTIGVAEIVSVQPKA